MIKYLLKTIDEIKDPRPKHINPTIQPIILFSLPNISKHNPTIGPPKAPPKKPIMECKANLDPRSSGLPLTTVPVVKEPESMIIKILYINKNIKANHKFIKNVIAVIIEIIKHIKPILLTT